VLFPFYVGVFIGPGEEAPHMASLSPLSIKKHMDYLRRLAPTLKGGFILIFLPYLL
jgi:hypothetical protein